MHDRQFVALTQQAIDAVSRRRSFLTIPGAAVVASTLGPVVTRAGKDAKKAKKLRKKKCNRQIDQCRNSLLDRCLGNPECEDIVENVLPCCSLLANCKATEALECFFFTEE